ncbi:hypothetical protein BJV78DRAFT_557790 [Lactifluus subvellereus]|nr:hypothetical protein BJV78DRAFT_557790 [Lactifluus subvellereus]
MEIARISSFSLSHCTTAKSKVGTFPVQYTSCSRTARTAAALSASTMSKLPLNLSEVSGSATGPPNSIIHTDVMQNQNAGGEGRGGKKAIRFIYSTDEALGGEPPDAPEVLCAHCESARECVWVCAVWRPDDEGLLCGDTRLGVGAGSHNLFFSLAQLRKWEKLPVGGFWGDCSTYIDREP